MDDSAQVALLRVLEDGTLRAVGESVDRHVDVRVIAATNVDLRLLADQGAFRPDLLFRFDVMRIELPALREIRDEIPRLVDHFVQLTSQQCGLAIGGVAPEVYRTLSAYDWPGNIRELKNAIAQACVTADRGVIGVEHLPERIRGNTSNGFAHHPAATNGTSATMHANGDHSATGPAVQPLNAPPAPEGIFLPIGATLDAVARAYVFKTLEACHDNKSQAARMLGLSRKTLYDRLARWGRL